MKVFLIFFAAFVTLCPGMVRARDLQRAFLDDSQPIVMPAGGWVDIPGQGGQEPGTESGNGSSSGGGGGSGDRTGRGGDGGYPGPLPQYPLGDARDGNPYNIIVEDGFDRAKSNWDIMSPKYSEVCAGYYQSVAALESEMRCVEALSRRLWDAKEESLDELYAEQVAHTETAKKAHNERVTNLLAAAQPKAAPPSTPRLVAILNGEKITLHHYDFITPQGTEEYSCLASVRSYRESALRYIAESGQVGVAERRDYLTIAHYAEYVADSAYAQGDTSTGDNVLGGARGMIDDVFDWNLVKDDISRNSTFLAGVLHGASGGAMWFRPLQGYERAFGAGEVVGAALGLVADGTGIAGGLAALGGSGVVTAGSGLALAPVTAVAATQASAAMAAGAAAGPVHWAKLKEGVERLQSPTGDKLQTNTSAAPPKTLLPKKNGEWVGKPGNSGWKSTKTEVLKITKGEPVPYENGYPNFDKWTLETVELSKFEGYGPDFSAADAVLAERMGFKSIREAEMWRSEMKLTWHHHQNGKKLQLVSIWLNKIPHTGGLGKLLPVVFL